MRVYGLNLYIFEDRVINDLRGKLDTRFSEKIFFFMHQEAQISGRRELLTLIFF